MADKKMESYFDKDGNEYAPIKSNDGSFEYYSSLSPNKNLSYGWDALTGGNGTDLGIGVPSKGVSQIGDPDDHATYTGKKNQEFVIGDPDDHATFTGSSNSLQAYKDAAATANAQSNAAGYEPFSYANAPSYTSKYQDQINSMIDSILNREAFSYDAESDPLYQQYRDQYTRNGGRAMVDTLGQVSARTGGLASSYAGQAAQQTYNGYMDELNNKVPELYQLAYSMYQDRDQTDRQNLSLLQALEDQDYNRYLDQLAQYNKNRNFAYDQYKDSISGGDSTESTGPDYMSILNDSNASTAEKLYAASQLGLTNSTQLAGLGLDGKTQPASSQEQHRSDLIDLEKDLQIVAGTQGTNRAKSYAFEAYKNGIIDVSEYQHYVKAIDKL